MLVTERSHLALTTPVAHYSIRKPHSPSLFLRDPQPNTTRQLIRPVRGRSLFSTMRLVVLYRVGSLSTLGRSYGNSRSLVPNSPRSRSRCAAVVQWVVVGRSVIQLIDHLVQQRSAALLLVSQRAQAKNNRKCAHDFRL